MAAGRLTERGEVVRPGTEGLAAVVADFGEGVLTPGGELDLSLIHI